MSIELKYLKYKNKYINLKKMFKQSQYGGEIIIYGRETSLYKENKVKIDNIISNIDGYTIYIINDLASIGINTSTIKQNKLYSINFSKIVNTPTADNSYKYIELGDSTNIDIDLVINYLQNVSEFTDFGISTNIIITYKTFGFYIGIFYTSIPTYIELTHLHFNNKHNISKCLEMFTNALRISNTIFTKINLKPNITFDILLDEHANIIDNKIIISKLFKMPIYYPVGIKGHYILERIAKNPSLLGVLKKEIPTLDPYALYKFGQDNFFLLENNILNILLPIDDPNIRKFIEHNLLRPVEHVYKEFKPKHINDYNCGNCTFTPYNIPKTSSINNTRNIKMISYVFFALRPHITDELKGILDSMEFKSKSLEEQIFIISNYNKLNKYTSGLIQNGLLLEEIFPGWICRIYYDNSLLSKENKQLYDIILRWLDTKHNIELIKYDFKDFQDEHGNHFTLFGAFVRIMPLFDDNISVLVLRDIDSIPLHKDYLEQERFIRDDSKTIHVYGFFNESTEGYFPPNTNCVVSNYLKLINDSNTNIIQIPETDHAYFEYNHIIKTLYPLGLVSIKNNKRLFNKALLTKMFEYIFKNQSYSDYMTKIINIYKDTVVTTENIFSIYSMSKYIEHLLKTSYTNFISKCFGELSIWSWNSDEAIFNALIFMAYNNNVELVASTTDLYYLSNINPNIDLKTLLEILLCKNLHIEENIKSINFDVFCSIYSKDIPKKTPKQCEEILHKAIIKMKELTDNHTEDPFDVKSFVGYWKRINQTEKTFTSSASIADYLNHKKFKEKLIQLYNIISPTIYFEEMLPY